LNQIALYSKSLKNTVFSFRLDIPEASITMPVLLSHSRSLLPIFSNIEYFDFTMDGIVILSAIDE